MYEQKRPASMADHRGPKEPRDPRREVEFMDFSMIGEDHKEQANLHQSVIMRPVAEKFKVYE